MHPIHDIDSLLLLSLAQAAKRRPAELGEIVAALDLLRSELAIESKLGESMDRLSTHGLIVEVDGGYALTEAAQAIVAALPKKGDTDARVFALKDSLSLHRPTSKSPAITLDGEALTAAIAAHRALLADGKRSLMVPKPAPPEDSGRGPGFKKRKPLPARKRRD